MTETTSDSRDSSAAHASAAGLLGRFNAIPERTDMRARQLATGIDPLDSALGGGLSSGDLCVIGGAPGVGKTIAALQIARNMAVAGHTVLYGCYEHDLPTLLGRLVAMEVGSLDAPIAPGDLALIRDSVNALMTGEWSAAHPGARHPTMRAAMAQVDEYGDRLVLAQLSTSRGGIDVINERMLETDPSFDAVFVDYLQKVSVPGVAAGIDRWTIAVEELKDMALRHGCVMVAISSLDRESLKTRRVTLDGFRGADAIAHEADVALVLNDKLKIVSRSHLAYDTTLYDAFAKTVVLTIEKNRRGPAPIDMEFRKEFARFRINPVGCFVAEQLIDDILVDN